MSKLSTFIHAHAGVFKMGTEVLGLAISELPIPEAAKLPLMGVLVEMNKTANNMGDNANTVAQNLLSELSGGVSETHVTNPQVQRGLETVGSLASSAAAILSASGGQPSGNVTVPNAPDAPPPSSAPSLLTTASAAAPVSGASGTLPTKGMAPSQPSPSDAPAQPVPPPLDQTSISQMAPATQVSLGLAVDPNSAHVGPVPPVPDQTASASDAATAPTDPTLAHPGGGSDALNAAEKALQDAIASGDHSQIALAADAVAKAARDNEPSPQ